MKFRKIFNLSLHRSGTQSVHDLLVRSGLSSIHFPGVVKGTDYQERVSGHEDDLDYVADVLSPVFDRVTAIGDVPIGVLYRQLAAIPESAFLLALRNPLAWVRSVRHHVGERDLNGFEKVQYWRCLTGRPRSLREVDDAALCAGYLSHVLEVIRFFEDRRDILLFDLEDPQAGEQICGFLGLAPTSLRRVDFRRGEGVAAHVFEK